MIPKPRPRSRPGVRFRTGQIVNWPRSPLGWAQVIELRRTCVRLYYRRKSGREQRPVVNAAKLARVQETRQPPLPLINPYGRGMLRPEEKEFEL